MPIQRTAVVAALALLAMIFSLTPVAKAGAGEVKDIETDQTCPFSNDNIKWCSRYWHKDYRKTSVVGALYRTENDKPYFYLVLNVAGLQGGDADSNDAFLMKFKKDGSEKWSVKWSVDIKKEVDVTSLRASGLGLDQEDEDGPIVVTGRAGKRSSFLISFDPDGTKIRSTVTDFGLPPEESFYLEDVDVRKEENDSRLYLAGLIQTIDPAIKTVTIKVLAAMKLDDQYGELWSYRYRDSETGAIKNRTGGEAGVVTAAGFYVGGYSPEGAGNSNGLVVLLDFDSGRLKWDTQIGRCHPLSRGCNDLALKSARPDHELYETVTRLTADGPGVVAVGYRKNDRTHDDDPADTFVVHVNEQGLPRTVAVTNLKNLNEAGDDKAGAIVVSNTHLGYVAAGAIQYSPLGILRAFLYRFYADGGGNLQELNIGGEGIGGINITGAVAVNDQRDGFVAAGSVQPGSRDKKKAFVLYYQLPGKQEGEGFTQSDQQKENDEESSQEGVAPGGDSCLSQQQQLNQINQQLQDLQQQQRQAQASLNQCQQQSQQGCYQRGVEAGRQAAGDGQRCWKDNDCQEYDDNGRCVNGFCISGSGKKKKFSPQPGWRQRGSGRFSFPEREPQSSGGQQPPTQVRVGGNGVDKRQSPF